MRVESTGNRRNSLSCWKAAAFSGGTSRMNREIHVRICERLGVRFPGPTRRSAGNCGPYADLTRNPEVIDSQFLVCRPHMETRSHVTPRPARPARSHTNAEAILGAENRSKQSYGSLYE